MTVCIIAALIQASGTVQAAGESRLKVNAVTITGNRSFSAGRLERVMATKASRFLRKSYYYPEVLEDDLHAMVEFYRQNGYLDAEVTHSRVETDSTSMTVDIEMEVSEGEVTRVEGLSVLGNKVFDDGLILNRIILSPGAPLISQQIQDSRRSILSAYAERGYIEAEVTTDLRVNQLDHTALVDFQISEGSQFRIAEVKLEGLSKTRRQVVMRELLFRPGEVIRYSRLLESQRRLYVTGLFRSVVIRPVSTPDSDPAAKNILIEINENISGEFNLGLGYGSIDKLRGRVGIIGNNLAGTARRAGITGRLSFVRSSLETSFTEPWTFGTRWQTDANLILEKLDEPGYELSRFGREIIIGRNISRRSKVAFNYRNENNRLDNVTVAKVPEKYRTNIHSLGVTMIYDTRNNFFNPRQGFYIEWQNELAGFLALGTDNFVRSVWKFKYFHPMRGETILSTALELGWMDVFGESREIPLNERFYSGGPNSLRGFGYRLAGPLGANGVPLGGNLKLVWNLIEIRRPIYKSIGAVIFVDVGNVWSDSSQYNYRDLRISPGIGVRANTPIGILRCDYGLNIRPNPGESRSRLYFNMGQAF